MQIPLLLPGQDFLTEDTNIRGEQVYVYAYRSLQGEFFSCTATTEEEAKEKCKSWLLLKERH